MPLSTSRVMSSMSTSRSNPAVASSRPSGENAVAQTALLCPRRVRSRLPSLARQILGRGIESWEELATPESWERMQALRQQTIQAWGEGLQAAIDRSHAYLEAGADGIFAEALEDAGQFQQFAAAVPAPVLANMTEFGRSPLLAVDELRQAGIRMALYPLTAFRAMSAAADRAYRNIGLAPADPTYLYSDLSHRYFDGEGYARFDRLCRAALTPTVASLPAARNRL